MKKYLFIFAVAVVLVSAFGFNFASAQTPVATQTTEQTITANGYLTSTLQSSNTLRILARIDYDRPAGANYGMEVYVNDKLITSALKNKGGSFTYQDGRSFPYLSGNAWMLFYSPDFSSNNSASGGGYQVMTDPGQAYLYSWDVSSIVKGSPTMRIRINNTGKTAGKSIIARILSQYPIAELGNCTDETSCRAYCSKQENYAVCSDYGQKNNIISPEDAAKAKEYADVLKGEGPGGCKDEASCKTYCDGVAHLSECISFAQKHNLVSPEQLAEAQKIQTALAGGAKMPGSCADEASCTSYCKVAAHIEECFAFAKAAGKISGQDAAEAEKVIPLIANGEAPGGCADKATCQAYCTDTSHAVECVNFAVKIGQATPEEAAMVKATGGVGPGGCKSKDACETYCNQKENQQSCFDFGMKYNLIPADKLKEMKDGMGRLRSGLDQMPPEAVACLKDNLGQDIVTKIQDGSFAPGPQAGDVIKGCFDKIMPQMQAKLQQGLSQADATTTQCLKNGLGQDGLDKIKNGEAPTPENGDVFRKCFETMKTEGLKKLKAGLLKMPPEIKTCVTDKLGADTVSKIEGGQTVDLSPEIGTTIQDCVKAGTAALEQKMQEGLSKAPPAMRECIQSKLGNVSEKMQSGELSGESDIQAIIQSCASGMMPSGGSGGNIPSGGGAPDAETIKKMMEQNGGAPPAGFQMPEGATAPPAGWVPGSGSSGGSVPPSGVGVPPVGGVPQIDCSQFAAVPSCSYVPAGVAQDACNKCKK